MRLPRMLAPQPRESDSKPRQEPLLADPGAIVRVCPNCDAQLIERKCKLLCQRCGYYMSCADYY